MHKRSLLVIGLLLIVIGLTLFWASAAPSVASSQLFTSQCYNEDPAFTVSAYIWVIRYNGGSSWTYLYNDWNTTALHLFERAYGRNPFIGYNTKYGGWDIPITTLMSSLRYVIQWWGGVKGTLSNYIFAYHVPDGEWYLLAFTGTQIAQQSTDANGEHLGNHPCGAIAVSHTEFMSIMSEFGITP